MVLLLLVGLLVVLLNPDLAVLVRSSTVTGDLVVVVERVVLFGCVETIGNRAKGLVVTNVTGLFTTVLLIFDGLIGSRLKTFTADNAGKLLLPVVRFAFGFDALLPVVVSVWDPTTSALLIKSADPLTIVGVLMTKTSLLMSSRSWSTMSLNADLTKLATMSKSPLDGTGNRW